MEDIEEILKVAKVLDSKKKETQKVGSNYYSKDGANKDFILEQAKKFMYTNIFHFDSEKGSMMIEAELSSWFLNLFGGQKDSCASITSGGTESIFLTLFAYREYGRKLRNITHPEIILNETAHPAFHKAAYYLDIKLRLLKINESTGLTPLSQYTSKINSNTIAIVMTGISYPHGLVDPIVELNDYLLRKNSKVWIAVDSCLGGYFTSVSKYLQDGNYPVIDFTLEKVGTITCDPHKYGLAPKGVSVAMFRNS